MSEKSLASGSLQGSDLDRSRAIAIFRYLRDLAQLRSKIVRDLTSYERTFWLDELRGRPDCEARCFREVDVSDRIDGDEWAVVRKRAEPVRPPLPEVVTRWVEPGTGVSVDSPPRLIDRIQKTPTAEVEEEFEHGLEGPMDLLEEDGFERLADHPEVARAFDAFMRSRWEPWAAEHRAWQEYQAKVYNPLFLIHRDLLRLGEEFELVLGIGCLTWRPDGGQQVRRHLVTAPALLEFDAARGTFTLGLAPEGSGLAVETDMLDPGERPSLDQMKGVQSDLEKTGGDPWAFEAVDRVLHGFVNAVHGRGEYCPNAYRAGEFGPDPRVAFAPALLLRKRTARGKVKALETVISQLEGGGEIPEGVRRLTRAAGPRSDGGQARAGADGGADTERIYFPLPANEDQRKIVERLNESHGVLVQGPPGTGKSHTIANLISHLLATGNRILVTAESPRALGVLRDKLPEGIRPLCLSVLGNDRAAQDNVKSSVEGILGRVEGWNEASEIDSLERAERDLDDLMRREAELEREVRTFREAETYTQTVCDGAYRGTASSIARAVRKDAERYGWLVDAVGLDEACPVTVEDLKEFRRLLGLVSPERELECGLSRPDPGVTVPEPDAIAGQWDELAALGARIGCAPADEPEFATASDHDLREALVAMRALQAAVRGVPVRAAPWAAGALSDALRGAGSAWRRRQERTEAALAEHGDEAGVLASLSVRLPEGRRLDELLADASDLLDHLRRGGRMGFLVFRPRVVRRTRYLAREASVDGRPCDQAGTLELLRRHLACAAGLRRGWEAWASTVEPASEDLGALVGGLRDLQSVLARVLSAGELAEVATAALARLALDETPALEDPAAVEAVAAALQRTLDRRRVAALEEALGASCALLRAMAGTAGAHPVCGRLADAVGRRDAGAVRAACEEIEGLERDAALVVERDRLRRQIGSVLPGLAGSLAATHTDEAWDARIEGWDGAWSWARARAWLEHFTNPGRAREAEAELGRVKARILKRLAEAASLRAWRSCVSSMEPAHQQHLIAWQQAVKRFGKGRGPNAERHRRSAQGHLEQCQKAIPAWIMPLYRIFETVPPRPGMFDVLIVDEASQCGAESLILFYLAKKIIIVGDDKQISPQNVGVDRKDAAVLLKEHLSDVDLADTFDLENSLFKHGEVRFIQDNLMLKEHFRCVPEIIRFSDDLCYDNRLVPLRQYPTDRLAPLVARHLPWGVRTGDKKAANDAEADAIVDAVAACCGDPRYEGKSMGVISLLGDQQAKIIESRLIQRIGPEEVERRRIICGDAYSFQGDERHVMFLSLVAAPSGRSSKSYKALTTEDDERRFNVAASRAEDQVWLFHSLMPEDIPNKECLRWKLLNHFYEPARATAEANGVDLDALRVAAAGSRSDEPPEPFDSWFEVDVYLRLVARGYRVVPQFRAGRYLVDLMVEGRTRLAVECDGDQFHGPERLDADMGRQRQLERAGLRFWRVRGSEFYFDPDAAMASLWSQLDALGIEPAPAAGGTTDRGGHVAEVVLRRPVEMIEEENEDDTGYTDDDAAVA